MTFGKVLGLAALGVGTVVSGGSVLGVVASYAIYRKKEKENDKKNEEIAELKKQLEKIKKSLEILNSDSEYFHFIIAATAVGLATANADGNISEDESMDIKEFIGGIGNMHYPQHIKDILKGLEEKIPTLGTVMKYLEKVPPQSIKSLEELVETVIWSDRIEHESEIRFRIAFQELAKDIVYKKDDNQSNESTFLQEAKNNIEYILNLPEVA